VRIRNIHLLIGVLVFVIFVLTGQYMDRFIHSAMEQSDRLRFSMRANHIYILMSSLLHLSLGAHLKMSTVRWRAGLQMLGSLLITIATVILIWAFFYEPKDSLDRPFILLAMLASLTGAALHVFSTLKNEASGKSQ
jgi:hypothetical protein